MDNQVHNQIVSFIWGIADDCLRDVYVRGKYRDVILPMTVIDASKMKSPLPRNMGKKNCEFTSDIRNEIMRIFLEMEESEVSMIFNNDDFAYWSVTVERPLRLRVNPNGVIPAQQHAAYISQKIKDCGLENHAFYFYLLPLNDAETEKKTIMQHVLDGDVDL